MTGLTGGDRRRHRGVARDAERGTRDARGAELEAADVQIGGAVTARAVAVEAADRHVITRGADQGDVDEGPDRRAVTGEAAGHALVRARDGVERVITRGRVALRALGAGRNVVRGFAAWGHVAEKRRCRGMAADAVARGRMDRVPRGRAGIAGRGRRADEHAAVRRGPATGLTAGPR